MSEKFDIYEAVTNRIIDQMEQGKIPWNRPWLCVNDNTAVKHRDGKPYSVLNQMLLGEPGEYLSFLECKQRGGTIRKGAKARMVVFYKTISHLAQDEDGNLIVDDEGHFKFRTVPYLRYSNVFHISDCEGVQPKWDKPFVPNEIPEDERAEAALSDYLTRSGVKLRHVKQNRAFYAPLTDSITLPIRGQFKHMAEYYSTAFHEATHSTGHAKRLHRFDVFTETKEDYSKEELVAEIGAAAIMNTLGLETADSFKNSAAYLQGWLSALKNDKRLIVSAAAKADKAARLILNMADESGDAKGADAE